MQTHLNEMVGKGESSEALEGVLKQMSDYSFADKRIALT